MLTSSIVTVVLLSGSRAVKHHILQNTYLGVPWTNRLFKDVGQYKFASCGSAEVPLPLTLEMHATTMHITHPCPAMYRREANASLLGLMGAVDPHACAAWLTAQRSLGHTLLELQPIERETID